jgi:hypothetical protein
MTSPKSTSALSPSDISFEKPRSRDFAQSRTAVTRAPDCDTNAMPAGQRVCMRKARVQVERGHEQSNAIRTQHAQQVRFGRGEHLIA